MPPELIKAIMKHIPDYFTWDADRQEQYRACLPGEIDFKIRQFLIKAYFDIAVTDPDHLEDIWEDLTDDQYLKINSALLHLQGIGEDLFFFNECFDTHQTLFSFETLYDYDLNDHQYQEGLLKKEDHDYQPKSYKGKLYHVWARLMIDGVFSYTTLTMAAGYIFAKLEEYGLSHIDELIPHEHVPGPKHGEFQNDGYLWDMELDAGGLEAQLNELQNRFHEYQKKVFVRLPDEFDAQSSRQVLILDESTDLETAHHFVFTDKEVLKNIHLKTFMRDCRIVEQKDHSEFLQKLEEEKLSLKKFLDSQHEDIMENFNPNILKFKKKRKLVFPDKSLLDRFS